MSMTTVFITGASGLIGRQVLQLLVSHGVDRAYALGRGSNADHRVIADLELRLVPGDLRQPGLGISAELRTRLAREVTTVVHLAANTSFSQTLDEALDVNRDGTRRLLELSGDWPHVSRWVYVSTAFVAGLRTGRVLESDPPALAWANAYEQSK